ncbi:hypothetical protein RFI_36259, partial [Reticulomyxa filosa]
MLTLSTTILQTKKDKMLMKKNFLTREFPLCCGCVWSSIVFIAVYMLLKEMNTPKYGATNIAGLILFGFIYVLSTSAFCTYFLYSSTLEMTLIPFKKSDLPCDVTNSNQAVQICNQSYNGKSAAYGGQSKNTTNVSDMSQSDDEYHKEHQFCTNFCNVAVEEWERKEISVGRKQKNYFFTEWGKTLIPVAQKEIERWLQNENFMFSGETISQWDHSTWQFKVKNGVARTQIRESWEKLKKKQHNNNKAKCGHKKDKHTIMSEYGQHSTRGIVGFQNLGNTCYLNAAIQCLLQVRPLMKMEWSSQPEENTFGKEWIHLTNE